MRRIISFTPLFIFLFLSMTAKAQPGCNPKLYGTSPFQDSLWSVDTATYAIIDRVAPSLPGFTITGIVGLTYNPANQQYYCLAKVSGVSGRVLCTINLNTAVLTSIGNLGFNFSSITFTPSGQLFGVTGDGSSPAETLFEIDPTNGNKTLLRALGNGADGEVICYNPDDNFLYHWSGNGVVVYEKIMSTPPYTITGITSGVGGSGEIFGAAYIGNGKFLLSTINSNFRTVTTGGTWAGPFGSNPDDLRGLVFHDSNIAEDICNGIDDDCDGDIDDNASIEYYLDSDNDGFGDPDSFIYSCEPVAGYVLNQQDCNDEDFGINPEALEVCDQLDNNCNELIDETCGCIDPLAHNYNQNAVYDTGGCETCSDGIKNGDEDGIDCGGNNPACSACPPPVAVCYSNTVTLTVTPADLVYNGPGTADVFVLPATLFDNGSTALGSTDFEVARLTFPVASSSSSTSTFNWTTLGACTDATPGGGITNEDKGYSWESCLPITPQDFNKIRNYKLKVSNVYGTSICSNGKYKIVYNSGTNPLEIIENTGDDKEIWSEGDLHLFPNPGTDRLMVTLNSDLVQGTQVTLLLQDMFGRKVLEVESPTTPFIEWDTQQLTPGAYTIKLISEKKTESKVWVKI